MIHVPDTILAFIPYSASLLLSLALGIYGLTRRRVTGSRIFSVICFSQAFWFAGYIAEILAPSLDAKIFWDGLQWFGTIMVVVGILALSLRIQNNPVILSNGFWIGAAGFASFMTVGAIGTLPRYLFVKNPVPLDSPPFVFLAYQMGPLSLVVSILILTALGAGMMIIFQSCFSTQKFIRRRALILLLAYSVPFLLGLLAFLDVRLLPQLDISPFTFAVCNLIVAVGLYKFRIFSLVPVARDKLLEMMNDAFFVIDDQDRIIDANASAQKLSGRKNSIVAGLCGNLDRNLCDILRAPSDGESKTPAEYALKIDGIDRWFEATSIPLIDLWREIRGKLVFLRDITVRKASELRIREAMESLDHRVKERTAELRESERRYRLIAENTGDVIWIFDLETMRFRYVSPSILQLRGYTPEEAMAQGLSETVTPESLAYIERILPENLENYRKGIRETRTDQISQPCKDGSIIWTETVTRIMTDEISGGLIVLGVARNITERKLAEEKLKESERKARAIFDLSFEFIGLLTPEGILLDANKTALDFAGISLPDVKGKPFWETPWWSHSTQTQDIIKTAIKTAAKGDWVHSEAIHPALDGSLHAVDFTLRPVKDESGRVILLIPEGRDITERKRMETRLKESEAKFSKAFHSNPLVMTITRVKDDKIIEVNAAFERLSGYLRNEAIGQTTAELSLYEDRRFATEFDRLLETRGSAENFEARFRAKNGALISCFLSAEIVEIGGERCIIVAAIDITTIKQLEARLKESETKFSKVFHGNPVSMNITRLRDNSIIEVNDAFEKFSGYKRDEVLGRSVQEMGFFTDPSVFAEHRRILSTNGRVQNFEVGLFHKTGKIFNCLIFSEIVELAGEPYVITATMDITERRQLEDQIRQAQKMESIGQLAGGVAHDFNNILTSIIGTAEMMLMRDGINQNGRSEVALIRQSALRAADLTRQLLTFSRRRKTKKEELSLDLVVKGAIPMLRRMVRENIAIQIDVNAPAALILADQTNIEQVLINLIVNAGDAINGEGRIVIGTRMADPVPRKTDPAETCSVLLSVLDSGHGIPGEIRDRIFEPFFTTKETGKGTGLGLSVVYGIVKDLNGTITIADGPDGRGSLFSIELPCLAGIAVLKKETAAEFSTLRGDATVLVVEDDAFVCSFIRESLTEKGFEVLSAGTAAEGLETAAKFKDRIALVISDVVMPEMNGLELTSKIAALCPAARFLLISGYNDVIVNNETQRDSRFDFLEKPFGHHELLVKVKTILEKNRTEKP